MNKFACIFCGGGGPSPEHIWSDWMAPYFVRTPHDQHEERRAASPVGTARQNAVPTDRHGNMVNRKVRSAVCGKCNNGWMSQIESAAKEPLLRLMLRQKHVVGPADQLAIANWVALKMFVVEFDRPRSPTFTDIDRVQFFRDRMLPDTLVINMFAYAGGGIWTAALHRQTLWIGDKASSAADFGADPVRNTLCMTFGVGQVVFQALHSSAIYVNIAVLPEVGARICPQDSEIAWPPARILDTEQVEELKVTLDDYLRRRGTYLPFR